MTRIFIVLFLFLENILVAQPIKTDSTLFVKPLFLIGDEKAYLVTEKTRDNVRIIPLKAEHKFIITFKVLDTANGYTFLYTVKTIETRNNGDYLESIRANISDNLKIVFKINKDGWLIDLKNYSHEQIRIAGLVDSIIAVGDKKDKYYFELLNLLKKKLLEPTGLELCLAPMRLFNDLYIKPVFRVNRDYSYGTTMNIFSQPVFAGTIILQWKKNKDKGDIARVAVGFVATSYSAAKYMAQAYKEVYGELTKGKSPGYIPDEVKSTSETEYDIFLSDGYPQKVHHRKKDFYLNKMIREIEMELIE